MISVLALEQTLEHWGQSCKVDQMHSHVSFFRTLINKEGEPENWHRDVWVDEHEDVEPSNSLVCPT